MESRIDYSEHPYISWDHYENYTNERREWENNPSGVDRYGRHHDYFGCYFDWSERKIEAYKNDPAEALKDAEYMVEKHGGEVWMESKLREMILQQQQA